MKATTKSPKIALVTDRLLLPAAATFLAKHRFWLVLVPWLGARLVQLAFLAHSSDVRRYFDMANAWFAGQTPYHDFLSEYPPGALLLFALPRFFAEAFPAYVFAFAVEMLCVDVAIMFMLARLPAAVAGVEPRDAHARYDGHVCMLVYVALSSLLVSVGLERYDLACAALILAFLYAAVGSARLVFADLILSVGIWVKLIPALCVPLYLAYVYASAAGRSPAFWYKQQPPLRVWFAKEGWRRLASLAIFSGLLFAPFYWAAGQDLWGFLRYHAMRGLQLESIYANVYMLVHRLLGTSLTTTYGFGALEVFDPAHANVRLWIARGSSAVTVALSLGISARFATKLCSNSCTPAQRRAFLCTGTLAQVLSLMAFNKVLSPQYFLWIAPLAPLAFLDDRPKRRQFVVGAFIATFLTSLVWMFYYRNIMQFEPFGLAILTCRNLFLLTLLWVAMDVGGQCIRVGERATGLLTPRVLAIGATSIGLIWAFVANLSETTANDIWIQLRSGADIVASGHFPSSEAYSATVMNRPFIAHEWLSSVLFYSLVQLCGGAGLSFVAALVAVVAAVLLYASQPAVIRRTLHYAPLLLGCVYLISFRLLLRPHIFTIAAQCGLMFGLERWRRSGKISELLWFVPMQLLWVNLHGGAFFGPALLFALAGVVWLMVFFEGLQKNSETRKFGWADVKALLGVGAAMSAACLCNPYGWRLLRFSVELLNNDYAKNRVWEWTTPFLASNMTYYWLWLYVACLVTLWVTLLARAATLPLIDLFLAALVSYLSMRANRFVPEFAIFSFPIIARSLAWISDRALAPHHSRRRPLLEMGLATLLLCNAVTYGYAHSSREHRPIVNWGFGGDMPYQEVALLHKIKARGIIFNEYSDGALIIHSLVPQVRPVLDSRIDLYPLDVVQEYDSAYTNPQSFEAYVKRHHVNYAMFKRSRAIPAVLAALADNPQWRLLSDSNDRVLYRRQSGSDAAPAAMPRAAGLPSMLSAFPGDSRP